MLIFYLLYVNPIRTLNRLPRRLVLWLPAFFYSNSALDLHWCHMSWRNLYLGKAKTNSRLVLLALGERLIRHLFFVGGRRPDESKSLLMRLLISLCLPLSLSFWCKIQCSAARGECPKTHSLVFGKEDSSAPPIDHRYFIPGRNEESTYTHTRICPQLVEMQKYRRYRHFSPLIAIKILLLTGRNISSISRPWKEMARCWNRTRGTLDKWSSDEPEIALFVSSYFSPYYVPLLTYF